MPKVNFNWQILTKLTASLRILLLALATEKSLSGDNSIKTGLPNNVPNQNLRLKFACFMTYQPATGSLASVKGQPRPHVQIHAHTVHYA